MEERGDGGVYLQSGRVEAVVGARRGERGGGRRSEASAAAVVRAR
jgi:hypothetical protein